MTPKEKAQELHKKYFQKTTLKGEYSWSHEISKDCALIAVDEILGLCWNGNKIALEHWQEVKNEINLL